jgi:DNA-binding MarR family transcriptional regulator
MKQGRFADSIAPTLERKPIPIIKPHRRLPWEAAGQRPHSPRVRSGLEPFRVQAQPCRLFRSETKTELLFTPSTNRVIFVVVFKRPFFSSYTTSLWVRFLRFNLLSHKRLEEDLDKLGLTPPQFYVLATIGYAGGLPFGEIGAKMMVTVSNLTGIVDRLEEKKLVSRKRDENDRRVVHVVLTEKGAKLYKSTIPLFEKSISQIFSSLDKPQQKELSALLRKLNHLQA